MADRIYTGSYLGTGAAQTLSDMPFAPRWVEVVSEDSLLGAVTQEGFKDGGYSVALLGDKAALSAAAGIVLTSTGFTVGTDASCNASGERFFFRCTG